MKLFYSGNSPYARRLRLVISVFGMADTVSVEDVAPLNTADHVLFKYGPGGRVPALLTDEGDFLCESLIIARYLDEVLDGKLYPTDPAARRFCFRLEG
ncbi:MAG: glutathione S-transferase, partial [Alphaproteobacteria bacterium]